MQICKFIKNNISLNFIMPKLAINHFKETISLKKGWKYDI